MSKRSRGARAGGTGGGRQQRQGASQQGPRGAGQSGATGAKQGSTGAGRQTPRQARRAAQVAERKRGGSGRRWSPWQLGAGAAAILVIVVVLVVVLTSSKSSAPPVSFTGTGYENVNTSNTRSTGGPIDLASVSKLRVAWTLPLNAKAPYGAYASTPVIANGVVYSQDLESNVQAIDLKTGQVLWTKDFNSMDNGPNGIVVADGEVFGATNTSAFALDQKTGAQIWSVSLIGNEHEGIDMAPTYHDGTVYVSTVAAQLSVSENGGGIGVLWALEAKTGRKLWHFNTVPQDLWSSEHSSVNSGGGLWYSPAFDEHGGMYFGVANPTPVPGTEESPWGASRPGPDLYTDSLVKLNAKTGKLEWYYQVTPHDLYDWDFQDPPILLQSKGRQIIIGAGKSGVIAALDANSGKLLWRRDVGIHNGHDHDGLYAMRQEYSKLKLPETIYPGELGGVIAQMSTNGSSVFAPVVNLPATFKGQASPEEGPEESGEVAAVSVATGKIEWTHKFPAPAFGATTVVNNLVFVPTFDGELYALNASNGEVAWEHELPAGSNGGAAVDGNTLIIGAGKAVSSGQQPALVAYRLGG
jgi:outer membrane protein assembly factor BamB